MDWTEIRRQAIAAGAFIFLMWVSSTENLYLMGSVIITLAFIMPFLLFPFFDNLDQHASDSSTLASIVRFISCLASSSLRCLRTNSAFTSATCCSIPALALASANCCSLGAPGAKTDQVRSNFEWKQLHTEAAVGHRLVAFAA